MPHLNVKVSKLIKQQAVESSCDESSDTETCVSRKVKRTDDQFNDFVNKLQKIFPKPIKSCRSDERDERTKASSPKSYEGEPELVARSLPNIPSYFDKHGPSVFSDYDDSDCDSSLERSPDKSTSVQSLRQLGQRGRYLDVPEKSSRTNRSKSHERSQLEPSDLLRKKQKSLVPIAFDEGSKTNFETYDNYHTIHTTSELHRAPFDKLWKFGKRDKFVSCNEINERPFYSLDNVEFERYVPPGDRDGARNLKSARDSNVSECSRCCCCCCGIGKRPAATPIQQYLESYYQRTVRNVNTVQAVWELYAD